MEGATRCQAREILDRVGDKWSLVLIYLLAGRTIRFMELRGAIPQISQRMLTVTLRHLERDGLVERTAYAATFLSHGSEHRIRDRYALVH